jgi:phospholipase C
MFPKFLVRQGLVSILILGLGLWLSGCRGIGGGSTNAPPPPGNNNSTSTPVKHLIVVVMQNSSFDHLFGTFPGANGPKPGVPGFNQKDAAGNVVAPFPLTDFNPPDLPHTHSSYVITVDGGLMDKFAANNGDVSMGFYDNTVQGVDRLWGFAQQFALADNYFNPVMSSAPDDVLYMVSAFDNNFLFPVQPIYGPCQKPDSRAKAFTWTNVGDQLNSKGVSWGWYQEQLGVCGNYVATENPFQYFTSTHAAINLQDYSNFVSQLKSGSLPSVSFVQPAPSHDMHPGSGAVTVSASWLDNFIQSVQNSSVWPNTAIIVIWDEGGGWYDHVPPPAVDSQGLGVRVPMLVISPFAKRGYISHVQMDHVSILKFIQLNWNLPSLNARNSSPASGDLRDMFKF